MKITFLLLSLLLALGLNAQDNTKTSFDVGVDVYSRYVWRGLLFTDAPSIQPYMSVTKGGLSLMAWGSYATSKNYAEVDLFLSYTTGNLTIKLNDYFSEDESDMASTDFSDYNRNQTGHLVESSISYQLPISKLPITLLASTFIYGADLNADSSQNFSSYFEMKYPFSVNNYDLSVALGGTPAAGFYADGAGFVNLAVAASKTIKMTDAFSVPLNTSLIFHPHNRDVFFVVGISL